MDFFQKLQDDCGITREEFVRCRKEVMNFRNKYIAHSNDYEGAVPFLRITRDDLVTLDAMLTGFDDDIFGALKDYIEASADTYDEITKRIVQN